MLEMSTKSTAPAAGVIKDTTEATFMEDVVNASQKTPVVVDFWATWCGPCKTLGPLLEDAVTKAHGKVRMVKVDIDQNQRLAQTLVRQGLPLQSIPTVVAFWQGRVADMFQGALPASEIKAFVDRVAKLAGDGGVAEALADAEALLADGAAVDAAQAFAVVLGQEPENATAYSGLVRAHVALGDLDQAEAVLNGAPAEISASPEVEAAFAQIELARQAVNAGPVGDLRAAVSGDPDNHQARFDLALALHSSGDVQGAVDELLELFRRDREWNDGAARTQLFTIFDSMKPQDPIVLSGRRRLSSMIFA